MTTPTPTVQDPIADPEARRDALAARLFEAALGAFDLQTIYLGERLGLYQALADRGPATPSDLAERAGIHVRYAREWLEHQAVGGIVDVDDPGAAPEIRRYTLPAGHSAVLIDADSLSLMSPIARFAVGSSAPRSTPPPRA
jgi:hypothetical protein